MQELLLETSRLSTASFLRAPLGGEPDDAVLGWRAAMAQLVGPKEPHLLKAVAFAELQACTDAWFPPTPAADRPQVLRYRDALWIRGESALYDGATGLALPGSYLTRFPRQIQTPTCGTFRRELSTPISAHARLEQAWFIPFALCSNFGHFMTETIGYLWPFLTQASPNPLGKPVILMGCNPDDSAAQLVHGLIRAAHAFPLLEVHLPEALHFEEVLVPEPGFRLHATCSNTYLQAAHALADWLLDQLKFDAAATIRADKLYLSRSALGPAQRGVDQERALEARLQALGWTIVHPEELSLAEQIALYRSARVVAGFEGSALHGLAFLGLPNRPPGVVMLGDHPSPDYFLQFRAQRISGYFIQCTRPDPTSERPDWEKPRLLNGCVNTLAAMVDATAAAF